MSELKLTGKLIKIFPTNQVSDKFKKREFVIETEGEYPKPIKFELKQDKCDKIDGYQVGQNVEVYFNVDGRLWMNKDNKEVYFVSLSVWMIKDLGGDTATIAQKPVETAHEAEDNESLPF